MAYFFVPHHHYVFSSLLLLFFYPSILTLRFMNEQATEGLVRGQEVKDTGAPIMVPVGPATLGRILNVIG